MYTCFFLLVYAKLYSYDKLSTVRVIFSLWAWNLKCRVGTDPWLGCRCGHKGLSDLGTIFVGFLKMERLQICCVEISLFFKNGMWFTSPSPSKQQGQYAYRLLLYRPELGNRTQNEKTYFVRPSLYSEKTMLPSTGSNTSNMSFFRSRSGRLDKTLSLIMSTSKTHSMGT